jgi:proteasome-associated ATPase
MVEPDAMVAQLVALLDTSIRDVAATASERQRLYELRSFVSAIPGRLAELEELPSLRQQVAKQAMALAPLQAPPLQYGVFLGVCPAPQDAALGQSQQDAEETPWEALEALVASADEGRPSSCTPEQLERIRTELAELRSRWQTRRDVVVGTHGQRYEVSLAAQDICLTDLAEGDEVVLNKEYNVVGVRDQHSRGETAEVANVIHPKGTAKVLRVPDELSGDALEVQWPEGERFGVACDEKLRTQLRRGDIVQVVESSSASPRATAKIKPRLHVRSGGSEGVVVEISDRLFEQGVEIGDLVRVDARLQFAFEKLPSFETGGLALEDVPDVTYDDISGLDGQITLIREAIELPYIHRQLFEQYRLGRPKGILLHGPPGCGKTMIAKAVANSLTESIRTHLQAVEKRIEKCRTELRHGGIDADTLAAMREELRLDDVDPDNLDAALVRVQSVLRSENGIRSYFLNVKGPELLNKYVGETEHRIRRIFEEAKGNARFHTPVVIFFDEMESLFRARGSGRSSDVETTIVPQFLAEMDGVEASENVIIIGASNRHDMIDPAIMRPGRLDVKIDIYRPGKSAAMEIMAVYLTPDLPLQDDGQETLTDAVPAVAFKRHVVERTLRSMEPSITPGELSSLVAALPKGCDLRRARGQQEFAGRITGDHLRRAVDTGAQMEWLAERSISATVDLLFSPTSRMEAITSAGKRHTFPLSDFASGALLAALVARAKKEAVKRQVGASPAVGYGIGLIDLRTALNDEFRESAQQLAASRLDRELAPNYPGRPADVVVKVTVRFGEEEQDLWSVEKARPYEGSDSV